MTITTFTPRLSAFLCGEREFTTHHALTAGEFRGEMAAIWKRIGDALACVSYAEEQDYDLEDSQLQALSENFRRERGLTTAESTEAWFENRHITIDDLVDYFERNICLSRLNDNLEAIRSDYMPDEAKVSEVLWPDLVLSGAFEGLCQRLAQRLALASQNAQEDGVPKEATDLEFQQFLSRVGITPNELDAWKERTGCSQEWLEELVSLECLFKMQCSSLLSRENLVRELGRNRLDYVLVELAVAVFADENQAREAYLCVSEDGEDLAQVCAEARSAMNQGSTFLGTLPEQIQRKLISLQAGDILPPTREDGQYRLYQLHRKAEPDLEISEIRSRAAQRVFDAHFKVLVSNHIHWINPDEWKR